MNPSSLRTIVAISIGIIMITVMYCAAFLQFSFTLIIIGAAASCFLAGLYCYFLRPKPDESEGDGEAVLAAGLITLVAAANMEWVVWAISLAFIFIIHQSLGRIAKQISALEKRIPPHE